MSRLKIALVAHTDAPWTPHYARFFLARGHGVWLGSFAEDPVEGVEVVHLSSHAPQSGEHRHEYFTAVPRLRRLLREFAPDVVFAPYVLSNGLTASLAWRGPLVVSARGGDILQQGERSNLEAFVQRQIVRRVCRRADAIHAVSPELVEEIESLGVSRDKIAMFPVGVDLERFRLAPGAERPRRPAHHLHTEAGSRLRKPRIDCGSRRASRSRAPFPLYHARRRPPARRKAASGSRAGNRRPRRLPRQRSPRGDSGDPGLAQIYVSASSSDGASSSLLEAMASGIFPVISHIPANTRWIEHGRTGLYFEVGDTDQLANQLERAMDDPTLRADAAHRNRERVEADASMDANMLRLERLLTEAASRR